MKGKSGAELAKEYAQRLRSYLLSVDRPPMRGGRVNMTAVAKACGFDRQVLYTNPACRALIQKLDAETLTDTDQALEPVTTETVPTGELSLAKRRITLLEAENFELKRRLSTLQLQLQQFNSVSDSIILSGKRFIPPPSESSGR